MLETKFTYLFQKIFTQKQKKKIYTLLTLSVLAMIFETLSMFSIFPFLDYALSESSNSHKYLFLDQMITNFSENLKFVFFISIFISIFLLKAVYLTFFTYVKNNFVYNIRTEQSNNLFKSYLSKDYYFYLKNNSANLIRDLNDASLLSVFGRCIIELATEIIMFFGILIFLIFLNPKITISLAIFFGLLGVIFYHFFQKKASKWGMESKKFRGLKLQNMKESFGAIKDIKILGKESYFINYFSKNNYLENDNTKKHTFTSNLPRIWFEWFVVVGIVFLVINLNNDTINAAGVIPLLGIFGLAAYRIMPAINRIQIHLQEMRFCTSAIQPYADNSLNVKNSIIDTDGDTTQQTRCQNKIELKNLSFKFEKTEKKIIENLDLEIKKGDCIGIYGESGSGKTTLLNLFTGLLKPDEGKILVDDKNISLNKRKWQNNISYIPQNVFIIDDTILKNIALGEVESNINYEKVKESLKISNLENFVQKLPQGIHTKSGELGDRFSGGQKQRLAIARAIYNNANVFIFDEFTNFLDKENEDKIMKEISRMAGKTRVIISHNTEMLKLCDRIFELKDKKLIEKNLK
jgi:ATP-binding cassette, subfamily B, bacterial PglK